MLRSGSCTEILQFGVSPTSGTIITAATAANGTASDGHRNSTHLKKGRNRKILHGNPLPLSGRTLNASRDPMGPNSPKDGYLVNSSRSSIVVSVLVDPREAADGDGEGMIGSKTISRIFVVMLADSVKYVTYSCLLPRMGSGPHLVTS
ncbi:hypothetical protein Nepgr_009946 [Nepenthes gracilis]|uniref:Uncharacterized protein n=1 Tax=Nepenthes gracilis TaxID=150966 RepID=A0AAD3SC78_NEPGR|nr:hypothetical protein Nepgr_009946 [Nepenthes gracilis]